MADSVIEHRLDRLEAAIDEIRQAVAGINASLVTLTRLEERHRESREGLCRAHQRLDDVEKRLHQIEVALPILRLASGGVIALAVGVFGLLGMAIWRAVIGV